MDESKFSVKCMARSTPGRDRNIHKRCSEKRACYIQRHKQGQYVHHRKGCKVVEVLGDLYPNENGKSVQGLEWGISGIKFPS